MSNVLQFTKEFDEKQPEIMDVQIKPLVNDLLENDAEVRAAIKARLIECIGKMEKFDFGYHTKMTAIINCLLNTEETMETVKNKIAAVVDTDDMRYEINSAFEKVIMAKFGVLK